MESASKSSPALRSATVVGRAAALWELFHHLKLCMLWLMLRHDRKGVYAIMYGTGAINSVSLPPRVGSRIWTFDEGSEADSRIIRTLDDKSCMGY